MRRLMFKNHSNNFFRKVQVVFCIIKNTLSIEQKVCFLNKELGEVKNEEK